MTDRELLKTLFQTVLMEMANYPYGYANPNNEENIKNNNICRLLINLANSIKTHINKDEDQKWIEPIIEEVLTRTEGKVGFNEIETAIQYQRTLSKTNWRNIL